MTALLKKEREKWLANIRKDYENILSSEIIDTICQRFEKSLIEHDECVLEILVSSLPRQGWKLKR